VVQLADIRSTLIKELAYVRACEVDALLKSVEDAGGDLEIDSKEGQTVAIRVEIALGMDGLIRPEDQTSENLTTIASLEALIEQRRAEHEETN
jgi:hypothetical protein